MKAAVYTRGGTAEHAALCDAFLGEAGGWFTADDGTFWQVLTMDSGWGPGGLQTRWTLQEPQTVGRA